MRETSQDMVAQLITAAAAPAPDAAVAVMLAAALAGARALQDAGRGDVVLKADGTPQTAADLASDAAIRAALSAAWPEIPIVSEESRCDLPSDFAQRPFLLVDPLDGTREYMEGHPDHAVCIALIDRRRPVAAVIAAPMLRKAWTAAGAARAIDLDEALAPVGQGRLIHAAAGRPGARRLVTSRSRPDPVIEVLLRGLPGADVRRLGAVLKLVAVATGEACLFPTSNPSSEWDIAAGDALVWAAGGVMLGLDGAPLTYGHGERGFLHPPYAAGADLAIVQTALAQWPAN
jgi:3'(2'), 5'-bisphosphate nucleotidase